MGRAQADAAQLYQHGVPIYEWERHKQIVVQIRKQRDKALKQVAV
jgi:hypothetical protein